MHDSLLLKELIKILGDHLPLEKIPFLKDWIKSSDQWGSINLISSSEWIERFILYTKEENIQLDRFFIYLHGIIVDLADKTNTTLAPIKKQRNQSERNLEQTVERIFKNDSIAQKYFKLHIENCKIIKDLFRLVGEENLFKIIYLRNKYCHPYLTAYSIRPYLNEDLGIIEFDRNKYDKLNAIKIDEHELTSSLIAKLTPIENDLKKMSENFNDMRFL